MLAAQSIGHCEQSKWARRWRKIGAQSLYDQQHILVLLCDITAPYVADIADLAYVGDKRRGFVKAMPTTPAEMRSAAILLPARPAGVLRNDGTHDDIGTTRHYRHSSRYLCRL